MPHPVRTVAVVCALMAVPGALAAQAGCAAPEYRQFDFWIGTWKVVNLDAKESGKAGGARNHISAINDGCAILEQYTSGAFNGSSISYYDRAKKTWHQVWVDNQGRPLVQEGGFEHGAMVLRSAFPDGSSSRLTWTAKADGSVTQVWEKSTDGGKTWAVIFNGLYTKIDDGM